MNFMYIYFIEKKQKKVFFYVCLDIQAKMKFKFNQSTEMYECVNCPKAYKKLQVLYRHIEFECEGIERKPCPFEPCRYATLRKRNLMKHIMNIHGDE